MVFGKILNFQENGLGRLSVEVDLEVRGIYTSEDILHNLFKRVMQ
jgi:hypothetical protein